MKLASTTLAELEGLPERAVSQETRQLQGRSLPRPLAAQALDRLAAHEHRSTRR